MKGFSYTFSKMCVWVCKQAMFPVHPSISILHMLVGIFIYKEPECANIYLSDFCIIDVIYRF